MRCYRSCCSPSSFCSCVCRLCLVAASFAAPLPVHPSAAVGLRLLLPLARIVVLLLYHWFATSVPASGCVALRGRGVHGRVTGAAGSLRKRCDSGCCCTYCSLASMPRSCLAPPRKEVHRFLHVTTAVPLLRHPICPYSQRVESNFTASRTQLCSRSSCCQVRD